MKTMKTQLKRTLTLLLALTLLAGILSPSASAVDELDERIKSIGLRNASGVIIGEDESLSIAAGNRTYFYVFPADKDGNPIDKLYSFSCTIETISEHCSPKGSSLTEISVI